MSIRKTKIRKDQADACVILESWVSRVRAGEISVTLDFMNVPVTDDASNPISVTAMMVIAVKRKNKMR